jgi:hypothetical protein
MFMEIRLLVALLQLQLLRLIPVVLAATALLTACFRLSTRININDVGYSFSLPSCHNIPNLS